MTADALQQIASDALDTLAHKLDQGHSEQLIALLKTMARFHHYSWHNVCLITSQRPTATRVAGFQTWRSLKRHVRKGEKGIAILAPILGRRDREGDVDQTRVVVGFRAAYVFDVEQTEGEPLPATNDASGDPGDKTALLKAAIQHYGIDLAYVDDLDGARGTSGGGWIQILNGLSPAVEFMTLVHEFAHELLHRNADRPASRNIRELEAEAVAFIVATSTGIDASASSPDYIHLYGGDRESLTQALDRIQHAASPVLRALTAPAGD